MCLPSRLWVCVCGGVGLCILYVCVCVCRCVCVRRGGSVFDVKAGLLKCLFVGREVEAMTMTVY